MDKICQTCARWTPEDQLHRPVDLRRISTGTCRLSGKERKAGDMQGCFGWKMADEDELSRRGYEACQTNT